MTRQSAALHPGYRLTEICVTGVTQHPTRQAHLTALNSRDFQ